jgi:hypothetical protein
MRESLLHRVRVGWRMKEGPLMRVAGSDSPTFAGRYDWHRIALSIVAGAVLAHGFAVLVARWDTPLIGMHGWRQAQTAITSYWLLKGSPWLGYETPVLGPPWSVPYEFPFFQLLVAGLVKLTGLPLDSLGRLVSYLFLLLMIYPVRALAREYGRDGRAVLVFVSLLLASPTYLYWGTDFLIETFALCASFAFLAAADRAARTLRWTALLESVICGSVAALAKITTFATFYLLVSGVLLYRFVVRLRSRQPVLGAIVSAIAIMLPPPLIFWIWDRWADAQKAKCAICGPLISTSAEMRSFNFGTWAQFFSRDMVMTVVHDCRDALGGIAVIVTLLAFIILYHRKFDRRTGTLCAIAIAAFFLPLLVFTNLYIVHNYYYTENAVFLICAVALIIAGLFSVRQWVAAWSLLLLVVVSQLLWFYAYFARDIAHPLFRNQLEIAASIKSSTSPDGVAVIYGLEWSPIIPYYGERRALMQPEWIPMADVISRLHRVLSPVSGYPVEVIVRCPSPRDRNPEYVNMFRTFDTTFRKQNIGGCDVYFTRPGVKHGAM